MVMGFDVGNLQIKEPVVCGVTSLGMDHMEVLGELFSENFIFLLTDSSNFICCKLCGNFFFHFHGSVISGFGNLILNCPCVLLNFASDCFFCGGGGGGVGFKQCKMNELFSYLYDSICLTQEIPSMTLLFIKLEFSRYKSDMLATQLA